MTKRISLLKLSELDAKDLYMFECENRLFFEKMVPGRGEQYFKYDNFLHILHQLLEEQEKGISYYHLLKNESGTIVGRMNLVDIDQTQKIGHIGSFVIFYAWVFSNSAYRKNMTNFVKN